MDTLYGPHKTLPDQATHLWHPILKIADDTSKNRVWENQESGNTNDALSGRYYWSQGNVKRMRGLVNEFRELIREVEEEIEEFFFGDDHNSSC